MSKVIVSVDVEDWYHGPSLLSAGDPERSVERVRARQANPERAYRYVDACLEMLAAHGIAATFFWVAEYAQRYGHLVQRVVAHGHTTACHGLSHYSKIHPRTKAPYYTRAEFLERTTTARRILEDLSGQKVLGYRAPNAYVTGAMLDCLEELGFKYDSSVSANSLYNKTDSRLRGVTTTPYYPARGELHAGTSRRDIVEFPWPYLSVCGLRLPSAGGPLLRMFGSRLVIAGLRQSLRKGPTVFYFHPIDICRENFPFPFSFRRPLLWAFKGALVKRRIARVLEAFKDCTTNFEQVLAEWAVPGTRAPGAADP